MARKVLLLCLAALAFRLLPKSLRVQLKAQLKFIQLIGLLDTILVTMATNTAKTLAIEQRVTKVEQSYFPNTGGTVTGQVTVTGDHTVLGNFGVHGTGDVLGALGAHDGIAVTNGVTSDTVNTSGDVTVGNNIGVQGGTVYYGTGGAAIDSAEAAYLSGLSNPGMPTGASAPPINTSTASQCAGAFYTGSGAANWATDITNVVNGINVALSNAGIW
jgi:hypothetical protein